MPHEVIIEDKEAHEQLKPIADLDQNDRAIIFKMIHKMLNSNKFKTFFKENVGAL